jgi:acetyl-CoA synthetase
MERWPTIHKARRGTGSAPSMVDDAAERAAFTWAEARSGLAGLPAGRGLNIAYEAVDRHAAGAGADHVALRCLDRQGGVRR